MTHGRRLSTARVPGPGFLDTRKALPAGRQSPLFLGVAFFGYRNWRFRRSLDAPVKTRPRSERLSSSHRIWSAPREVTTRRSGDDSPIWQAGIASCDSDDCVGIDDVEPFFRQCRRADGSRLETRP